MPPKTQPKHSLEATFAATIQKNWSYASFRYPSETPTTFIQAGECPPVSDLNALENASGFLVAPFWLNAAHSYILQPDITLSGFEGTLVADPKQCYAQLFDDQKTIENNWHLPQNEVETHHATKPQFLAMVENVLKKLKELGLKKVVLSRTLAHQIPTAYSPTAFFELLCQSYPNAFVSLVSLPHVGTWIGASPELLLEINNDKTLKTVALAGTRHKLNPESTWGSKEIEEQALVSEYLLRFFEKLALKNSPKNHTETTEAGDLLHLKTSFEVALNQDLDVNQVLQMLHPTPAVGGLPKLEAQKIIAETEPHSRNFYAGFWGILNKPALGGTRLFVNLRTMQLLKNQFVLYVGAGITHQSDPEAEWKETELKAQTLLKYL